MAQMLGFNETHLYVKLLSNFSVGAGVSVSGINAAGA
jgi:hypothetical protein